MWNMWTPKSQFTRDGAICIRKGADEQMKRWLIVVLAVVMALCITCPAYADGTYTKNLIAGGGGSGTDVGDLTVSVTNENPSWAAVTIIFDTNESSWEMSETHLLIFSDSSMRKNSAPGNCFPFKGHEVVDPKQDVYDFLIQRGYTYYFAAHADVQMSGGGENEGAWAQGGDMADIAVRPNKNWATYFVVNVP
jgi:hypothetical protein